jgi:phage terminase large subunit GpA-like protein
MSEALAIADGFGVWCASAAEACAPRKALTVSEWADAKRVLSAKASAYAGPWRTARTPYLREIMDCLSARSPVQRVVFISSTQVGKSEAGLNWIGYVMDECPSPMLVVQPTIEVRRRFVLQRIEPMLRESPALAKLIGTLKTRESSNSQDIKDVPGGGMVIFGGANSPASLASMPVRFALLDEVDRYPWELGAEGDPITLIENRLKAFSRRKLFIVSTPTIRGASRIEEEWEQSDKRHYHVPCPHCGTGLVLQWKQLQWKERGEQAWYCCEHCGGVIEEADKAAMLAQGQWRATHPERGIRGYHLNALYAPPGLGYTWRELAQRWLRDHADPIKLKSFINTQLGEAWEDRSRDVRVQDLMARSEAYALREIPAGCLLITAGVDVQDDRLAVVLLGWGAEGQGWFLDWVELPGNPALSATWEALDELLCQPLLNAAGRELRIEATAVDTGGHHTHDVYQYVRSGKARRLMAVKGSNQPNQAILAARPKEQDVNWRGRLIRNGVRLWMVGVDTAKHWLINRLHADGQVDMGGRKLHFSKDLPEDFYQQLTAEVFDPEDNRWRRRRNRRNEALDCAVYAIAASQHPQLRVHAMRPADWRRLGLHLADGVAAPATPAPVADVPRGPVQTPAAPVAPTVSREKIPAAPTRRRSDEFSL